MRLAEFNQTVSQLWQVIAQISETHKLVNVFTDRIEAIE